MKTTRLTLRPSDVAAILPALEVMVNGLADAREGRYYHAGNPFIIPAKPTYSEKCFDEEMAATVLSCRNKLKFQGSSRKARLTSLEISAAALAYRVVRREKLAPEGVINAAVGSNLEARLELHRKRGKRAAITQVGITAYREEANRWSRFVQWCRAKLLRLRPLKRVFKMTLYKEQRETTRALAMEVVVETADRTRIHHLADLARRELRRGRHDTTLRSLLSDHDKTRRFLAEFIMDRDGVEIIRYEYQPLAIRASLRDDKFLSALCLGGEDYDKANQQPANLHPACQSKKEAHQAKRRVPELAPGVSTIPPQAEPRETGEIPPADLVRFLAHWFLNEVEPGYRHDVASELKMQVWTMADHYLRPTAATNVPDIIAECRLELNSSNAAEVIGLYASWGARWLLAVNRDLALVCTVIDNGYRSANEQQEKLDAMERRSKLKQIYRRY
jgi:hypothetical protein